MDPASAIAGFIGLGALVTQTAMAVKTLIGKFQGAPRELEDLANRLITLSNIIESLNTLYKSPPYPEETMQRTLWSTIASCEACIHKLGEMLRSIDQMSEATSSRRFWKRVRSTFKIEDILETNRKISSYWEVLDTILLSHLRSDMRTILDNTSHMHTEMSGNGTKMTAQLRNLESTFRTGFDCLRADVISQIASVQQSMLKQSGSIFQPTRASPLEDEEHLRHTLRNSVGGNASRTDIQSRTSVCREVNSDTALDEKTPPSKYLEYKYKNHSGIIYDRWFHIRSFFGTISVRYTTARTTAHGSSGAYTDINRHITINLVEPFRSHGCHINGHFNRSYQQYFNSVIYGSFRCSAIVPRGSPIFRAAERGDLQCMRFLFQERLAHPTDIDHMGGNLLLVATSSGNVEVCRYLLELGLDPLHGLSTLQDFSYTLIRACGGQNVTAVEEFLAHTNVEVVTPSWVLTSIRTWPLQRGVFEFARMFSSGTTSFLALFTEHVVFRPYISRTCKPLLDLLFKHGFCTKDLILSTRLPYQDDKLGVPLLWEILASYGTIMDLGIEIIEMGDDVQFRSLVPYHIPLTGSLWYGDIRWTMSYYTPAQSGYLHLIFRNPAYRPHAADYLPGLDYRHRLSLPYGYLHMHRQTQEYEASLIIMIARLLSAGADPHATDSDGFTPGELTVVAGMSRIWERALMLWKGKVSQHPTASCRDIRSFAMEKKEASFNWNFCITNEADLDMQLEVKGRQLFRHAMLDLSPEYVNLKEHPQREALSRCEPALQRTLNRRFKLKTIWDWDEDIVWRIYDESSPQSGNWAPDDLGATSTPILDLLRKLCLVQGITSTLHRGASIIIHLSKWQRFELFVLPIIGIYCGKSILRLLGLIYLLRILWCLLLSAIQRSTAGLSGHIYTRKSSTFFPYTGERRYSFRADKYITTAAIWKLVVDWMGEALNALG